MGFWLAATLLEEPFVERVEAKLWKLDVEICPIVFMTVEEPEGTVEDLVWSEPTRTIAKRLGISDVGLAKACRRADLLLPLKPQLPPRGPGMSDQIVLGRDRWNWGPDPVDLSPSDPPIPTFAETLEDVGARLREQVGTVPRTRDLGGAHPRIQKLLDAVEHRRARQAESPYPTDDALNRLRCDSLTLQ